jgi:DNA-binding NarL/FixJ family response regulator
VSSPSTQAEKDELSVAASAPTMLIASGKMRERIGKALGLEGFAVEVLAEDGELPESRGRCSSVVVWVEDPTASMARWLRELTLRFDGTPVVIVCADIQRWGIRSALASGVAGVVLLDDLRSTLGPCLGAVQAGQTCVPRAHGGQIEPPALSSREKQILGLVVMGFMNSQIAEQLFLAESTVKSHLSSAFGKLGVRSRNEAVKLILDSERGLGTGILALDVERL